MIDLKNGVWTSIFLLILISSVIADETSVEPQKTKLVFSTFNKDQIGLTLRRISEALDTEEITIPASASFTREDLSQLREAISNSPNSYNVFTGFSTGVSLTPSQKAAFDFAVENEKRLMRSDVLNKKVTVKEDLQKQSYFLPGGASPGYNSYSTSVTIGVYC